MNILNKAQLRMSTYSWSRLHLSEFIRDCSQHSPTAPKVRKKELIVNAKYGPVSSDPLYENLVYSSEVEVYLTAKRGKAWLEAMAAKKFQAENELRARQRIARSSPTPIALQYLFEGAQVQREENVVKDVEIDVKSEAVLLPDGSENVFPYAVYDRVNNVDDKENNENLNDLNTLTEPFLSATCESDTRRGRRKQKTRSKTIPPVEASDRLEFENITDPAHSTELRSVFTEDHLFKYGTANPNIKNSKTNIPCGGCGAHLHCLDEKIPGFVPSQIIGDRSESDLRSVLCQRCYIIKEYKVALKVNVSPEDYPKTIEHLRDKKALVLLVVDLLDYPGSVWPGILELLGSNKQIILVGNKFDMIVPDSDKYYRNITNTMRAEFLSKCWDENVSGNSAQAFPKIVGSCCVSATTGFNIELLVEQIFKYWRTSNHSMPGDIYIVGCTNVGKSSLFNALLDSDLCKLSALSLIQKAMISPVPGTTLNLLKFPVTRPEPHFLAKRQRRVAEANSEFRRLENARVKLLAESRDVKLAVPSHYTIKHTLENSLKEDGTSTENMYVNTIDLQNVDSAGLPARLDPDERVWGKHCHDTPGTVSEDQIINLLTAEEIGRVLPQKPLQPRTLLLRQGHSILLGGLARLDLLKAKSDIHPVRVTVFCSSDLPVNIVVTTGVDKFLKIASGTKLLGVPMEIRNDIPDMCGVKVEVTGVPGSGIGLNYGAGWIGSADIVLSSCGWVMVSPKQYEDVTFMAFTIGGKGIYKRPPFLPYSINLRGKRIQGTPSFRNDLVFVP